MAVVDFPAPLDPDLSRQLRDLPEFEPPAALWQRIAANVPPARAPASTRFWPLAAAAAVAVLAVGLGLGLRPAEPPATPLAGTAPSASPSTPAALAPVAAESQASLRRRLDVLDRSLQQALDRQAPEADIAALAGERQRIAAALAQAIQPDATILTL